MAPAISFMRRLTPMKASPEVWSRTSPFDVVNWPPWS